jgi:hypothetical protein
MARKARRYFPNRRNVSRPAQDTGERQAQVDQAARRLVEQHSWAELQSMLTDCATALEQADQAGTLDPGPISLARFRRARSDWEVMQRAVELAAAQARLEP